jgi:hypothetical protein
VLKLEGVLHGQKTKTPHLMRINPIIVSQTKEKSARHQRIEKQTMKVHFIFSLALIVLGTGPRFAEAQGRTVMPIKVILRVEPEGPEGLSAQAAKDLSASELTELRSLIRTEIDKLPGHVLVSANDPDEAIGVVVVAAKYGAGRATLVLLSSVITIAEADGAELFVSHDVIGAESLPSAAKAVGFYLTSVELRGMLDALRLGR